MDAYVFAAQASPQAVADVLALVGDGTARAALPTSGDRALYVAVTDSSAVTMVGKIASVTTVEGLVGVEVHLAFGSGTTERPFPTQGIVSDHVGFALLTTLPANVVGVYEAARAVSGVVGAAMVTGTVNVLVEATASTLTALESILATVEDLTGVLAASRMTGATSDGAGFTT